MNSFGRVECIFKLAFGEVLIIFGAIQILQCLIAFNLPSEGVQHILTLLDIMLSIVGK